MARTENVENTLSQTSDDFGEIVAMQRGDLNWKLSIREDGSLPQQGLCPSIIEWKNNAPPLAKMTDLGCRFQNLTLMSSEQTRLANALSSIGVDHLVQIDPAGESPDRIKLEIATPRGSVMLD